MKMNWSKGVGTLYILSECFGSLLCTGRSSVDLSVFDSHVIVLRIYTKCTTTTFRVQCFENVDMFTHLF